MSSTRTQPEEIRYQDLATIERTGARILTDAETSELDALDRLSSFGSPAPRRVRGIHDLPVCGWAWGEDARDLRA